jgi:hypothetical protein
MFVLDKIHPEWSEARKQIEEWERVSKFHEIICLL